MTCNLKYFLITRPDYKDARKIGELEKSEINLTSSIEHGNVNEFPLIDS
jgi:hypothetical protein